MYHKIYQVYHMKTTEIAISRLEISADFDRLKRKDKKHIIREVMTEYASDYDLSRDIAAPRSELLGIEQQVPVKGIIKLKEMAKLINKVNQNRILKFSNYKRSPIYLYDSVKKGCQSLLSHKHVRKNR